MGSGSNTARDYVSVIVLFIFEVVIMLVYGFKGQFLLFIGSHNRFAGPFMEYIFMGLLTMVGFGLILAYLGRGAVLGLATTLLCVGITVQVSPLLQSFWYLVFHGFNTVQETTEVFSTIYGGKMIHLLEYTEKIAMITACSLLLAMTCLIGKIGLFATIFTTFCFNIGWPLAYMANIYLYQNRAVVNIYNFDDYGTNFLYVFAGFFGLTTSLFVSCKPNDRNRHENSNNFVPLIGVAIIFSLFPFIGINFPNIPVTVGTSRIYGGPLNIYFSMAASVVCTYVFSSLFGKGTIGFKEILVGVISGGVTIAVSASLLTNIGACIAIGSFSGFLSSLWLCYVDPIINKNQINDNVGLAAILMNAIFGGLVFSPVFLSSRQTITLADVTIPQIVDSNVPIYQLVYITISAGTGIAFGILSGIFNLIGRNPESDFSNSKFFDYDYGLYNDKEPEESVKPLPSNSLSNQTPNNGTPGTQHHLM